MSKVAALLVSICVLLRTGVSYAAPRFDGQWSVSITTTKGDCVASYRYPMLIANGVLANGGALAIVVSGRVAPSGMIRVIVSQGETRATGYGRLRATTGSGLWSGASCSGSWTADRRTAAEESSLYGSPRIRARLRKSEAIRGDY